MKIFNTLSLIGFLIFGSCLNGKCDTIVFHTKYANFEGEVFTLKTNDFSLEGIFLGERNVSKPLLLFISGSQPVPLYCHTTDSVYYPLVPHQLIEYVETYNFVMLSKPGIPALVNLTRLNQDYYYLVGDSGKVPPKYQKHNNLPFYMLAYNALINSLGIISSYSELIIMGHSQGSRIVAELTANSKVDKIIYMSADPLGRIATVYDREYSNFKSRNNDTLQFYNSLFQAEKSDSLFWGDTYKAWRSFSRPPILSLTQSKVPTLIVYGKMDTSCPNCYVFSFLPSYFENIEVFDYENFDHNYFDENGKNNWGAVLEDVFYWIGNN